MQLNLMEIVRTTTIENSLCNLEFFIKFYNLEEEQLACKAKQAEMTVTVQQIADSSNSIKKIIQKYQVNIEDPSFKTHEINDQITGKLNLFDDKFNFHQSAKNNQEHNGQINYSK